jgi:hypothetical protein
LRVLRDENLPRRLKNEFDRDVDVVTVQERGWTGMKNGELLALAANEFDAFVTMDAGIEYQQNLVDVGIHVLILHATTNRLADLKPLMPEVNESLRTLSAEITQIIHVGN